MCKDCSKDKKQQQSTADFSEIITAAGEVVGSVLESVVVCGCTCAETVGDTASAAGEVAGALLEGIGEILS